MRNVKKERSLKEVIYENRGKIIAGVGLAACGVLSYVIFKNKSKINLMEDDINMLESDNLTLISCMESDILDLTADNATLSSILSEGVLQDAIATTSNKINSRVSRLNLLEDKIKLNPNDESMVQKISEIKKDIEILLTRKDLYESKLHNYEIKDLIE